MPKKAAETLVAAPAIGAGLPAAEELTPELVSTYGKAAVNAVSKMAAHHPMAAGVVKSLLKGLASAPLPIWAGTSALATFLKPWVNRNLRETPKTAPDTTRVANKTCSLQLQEPFEYVFLGRPAPLT